MIGLVEFLLARIEEDRRTACTSTPGRWGVVDDRGAAGTRHYLHSDGGYYITEMVINRPTADHMARWDPTRAVADCEARRRIVEMFAASARLNQCDTDELFFGETLRWMATLYREHPDYRQEWRP